MRRCAFVLLLIIGLAACATAPDVRWAQATSSFTAAVNALNALREPCVDAAMYPGAGPDHPLCRIDDATWAGGVLPLVREGRTVIVDADTAILGGQPQTVEWAVERVLAIVERLLVIKAMAEVSNQQLGVSPQLKAESLVLTARRIP